MESNQIGFFYTQEHVTPQAGRAPAHTVPQEYMDRELPDTTTDYTTSDIDFAVIEQVANLANDDMKKAAVEVMDDKLRIFQGVLRKDFFGELSFEQGLMFMMGYTNGEVDTVQATWKEKIRHDRIRPTSRVQRMSEPTKVDWYDGTQIPIKEWTPFMRVMPHAEFPSGSASICYGARDYINAWLVDNGMDPNDFPVNYPMPAGSSRIQEGFPAEDIVLEYANMEEVAVACAESRIWGGMHYPDSIEASAVLVEGYGQATYDWTVTLRNGEELPGVAEEDQVEVCGLSGKIKTKRRGADRAMKVNPDRRKPARSQSACECRDKCRAIEMPIFRYLETKQLCNCFDDNSKFMYMEQQPAIVGSTLDE